MPGSISDSYDGPGDEPPEIPLWAIPPREAFPNLTDAEYEAAYGERRVPDTCNVCGIKLRTEDEERMGMCDRCARESI